MVVVIELAMRAKRARVHCVAAERAAQSGPLRSAADGARAPLVAP